MTTLQIQMKKSQKKRNAFIRRFIGQTKALFKKFFEEDLFFQQENHCTISDDESKFCDGLPTAAKCLERLKNMKSNKKPGTEGTPAEFLKVFWNGFKPFFLYSVKVSHA